MRYARLIALLAVLLLGSCSTGGNNAIENNNVQVPELVLKPELGKSVKSIFVDPTPDWTWDLIAGQHYLAGTVSVYNDENTLYVTYETGADWPMSEAHLYVGSVPNTKGAPGQFPYKQDFDPAVHSYTFAVPLGNLADKSTIYLAAHASVGSETAWGGYWNNGAPSWDFGFGKKWGGGFATQVMPMPELPGTPVTYDAHHYGKFSYWGVHFSTALSLPPGSYVDGGVTRWVGWCVDRHHTMYSNHNYNVTLYSSYDQDIPALGQNANWDLINYMLTQRRNNGSGIWNQNWQNNAVKDQFQAACWKFSDGIDPASGSLAEAFVNDAIANGDNFIPGPGEFYAILLYPDTSTNNNSVRAQMNIIEVDP